MIKTLGEIIAGGKSANTAATILEKITLALKLTGVLFFVLFAFNVFAVQPSASSKTISSTDVKEGETRLEVDNGMPMNVDEFNQRTDDREKSTFCKAGQCDALPHLIKGGAPKYPKKLLRDEITGEVVVTFTIDVKGRVVKPQVKSATRPEFATSVISAIRAWKFSPATLHGKPVEIKVEQLFPFQIR